MMYYYYVSDVVQIAGGGMMTFILSKMRRHWRILGRGRTWSGLYFYMNNMQRTTLFPLLVKQNKTRNIGLSDFRNSRKILKSQLTFRVIFLEYFIYSVFKVGEYSMKISTVD